MSALPDILAAIIVVAMIVYVVSGGADFGGGIWDLLATGPRKQKQREALAEAIAPIWEANHVWLILVIVLMFVCFPPVFSAIMTALHIPLAVMLVGIVLRGASFAFRSYSAGSDIIERRSGTVFAVSSALTPFLLGVTVGAVASGDLTISEETGRVATDFISAWWAPFPFAIGFFLVSLCAFLAAVYMTVEVDDDELREDFRLRGLLAAGAVGAAAVLSFVLALGGAPVVWRGLSTTDWALSFQILTTVCALGAIIALWYRRYRWARLLAIAQTGLIITGWALAQYPFLVYPDLTIADSAAEPGVLGPVLVALAVGSLLLGPALFYLYRVFKGRAH